MVNLPSWVAQVARDFTPGAAGIWLLVVGAFGWWVQQARADRKLSLEDRQANREGFSATVAQMSSDLRHARAEISTLMSDQAELRQEYKAYRLACQEETDELRQDNVRLRATVEELRGQITILKTVLAQFKPGQDIVELVASLDRKHLPPATDQ